MTTENEYIEIVEHYDNVMTSGYYDHQEMAKTLQDLLGSRRKVLDIGVGTGLLTDDMLKLADYQIVGVDFSIKMLNVAEERLAGKGVELVHSDITQFETDEKFEAIISTGGVIYVVSEEGEYRLYSHITDKEKNEELLARLYSDLDDNGLIALAIQGPHIDYSRPIQDGIIYTQHIIRQPSCIDKRYLFSSPEGKQLAEQFCRLFFFDGRQSQRVFRDAGFIKEPQVFNDTFLVLYK
jgi:cyclopropane fatty-acyl-phospholipid synthase-like methyltransferase